MKKVWLLCLLLLCALVLSGCSGNESKRYEKALAIFAAGQYDEAAQAFDRLKDYAQAKQYAAYSRGLVLYEQARYAEAEPYFEETQGFMLAKERYFYCRAWRESEQLNWQAAQEWYALLGNFEDAPGQAAYCRGCVAEQSGDYENALYAFEEAGEVRDADERLLNLRMQVYQVAIDCKNKSEYETAIKLFCALGDYLSSADQAVECKEKQREAAYTEAERLYEEGSLQEAYRHFNALGSYRDAAQRAEELAQQLGIQID